MTQRVTPWRPAAVRSWPTVAHRAYSAVVDRFRASAPLYRLLFGHWPVAARGEQLWDWTTIALATALRRHVSPGTTMLDMGTGPVGVLSVYAKKRLRCRRVCGVDHMPELLASAMATAARCDADVAFIESDLFRSVSGFYDVIAFNAPYIPEREGQRLRTLPDARARRRWSGGTSGLETVEHFLREAPGHLASGGRILLGVNHFYVAASACDHACATLGLVEVDRITHRLTGAAVHVLHAGVTSTASS